MTFFFSFFPPLFSFIVSKKLNNEKTIVIIEVAALLIALYVMNQ